MERLNIEDFDIDLEEKETGEEETKAEEIRVEGDVFDDTEFEEEDALEEKGTMLETFGSVWEGICNWFREKSEQLMEMVKEPTNEIELYKYRIKKEKVIRCLMATGAAAGILLIVLLARYAVEHHVYDSYTVLNVSEKENTGVIHFVEFKGDVLHYSADGVTLATETESVIWTDSYQMSQPMIEIHDSVMVIYDRKGTLIRVYNEDGKIGAFQTDYPIIKADISAEGEVAVILENGDTTHLNYYTETGSLIASGTSNMRNPGYPVDLTVSRDGLSVVVSYFVADEDTISSYIAFYNFGDAGKNKEDNLIGGVRCVGVLVPDVEYLDNDRLIAYSEEGFKIYKVKNEPEEIKEMIFEQPIVSAFSDGERIGFVFRNEDGEEPFLLKLFDSNGNEKMETKIRILYDEIKISDDRIVMNNATQIAVYSMKGTEKFFGNIEEGNIHEVVKVGRNKYQVAYGGGVLTIKLK